MKKAKKEKIKKYIAQFKNLSSKESVKLIREAFPAIELKTAHEIFLSVFR